MKESLIKYVVKLMRETADKIETGNCELTESDAMDILSVISHQTMSKEDACIHLNMSRSRFDDLVREGKLPKGKKRRGFKELVYHKDDLDKAIWKTKHPLRY